MSSVAHHIDRELSFLNWIGFGVRHQRILKKVKKIDQSAVLFCCCFCLFLFTFRVQSTGMYGAIGCWVVFVQPEKKNEKVGLKPHSYLILCTDDITTLPLICWH